MADAIQKGIEAAQQDLVKESEEKLLEEVQISCSASKQTSANEKSFYHHKNIFWHFNTGVLN